MVQYGFYFDQGRCIGCNSCYLACNEWYGKSPGPERWMRVYQYEKGAFPNIQLRATAIPCYHCENPVCVDACPNQALYKEPKYGAVLVDPEKCKGARECWKACPYGATVYASDEFGTKTTKCTMCIDRLEQGLQPMCVMACDTRAFDFGPLEDLQKKYGTNRDLEDMPDSSIAQPAVIFKAQIPKKQIVPYDANKALALWQSRGPNAPADAPQVFADSRDVTDPQPGLIRRNKLVLHAQNNAELLYWTRHDE
jgi:anaerobic dimethyl sulfoxide reductase subunit B (iron-sulfur subunit)